MNTSLLLYLTQKKKPSRLVTFPGDYFSEESLLVRMVYFVLLLPNTKKES